jgi:hypothetical protein
MGDKYYYSTQYGKLIHIYRGDFRLYVRTRDRYNYYCKVGGGIWDQTQTRPDDSKICKTCLKNEATNTTFKR